MDYVLLFQSRFSNTSSHLRERTCIKCSVSGWLSGASGPSLPPDFGSLVTSLFDAAPAGWRVKPHQLHVVVGPGAQLAAARPQTGFFTGNCAFCFLPIFCAPRLTQDPSRDCEKSRMQHLRSRLLREQKGSESALLPSLLRLEDVVVRDKLRQNSRAISLDATKDMLRTPEPVQVSYAN